MHHREHREGNSAGLSALCRRRGVCLLMLAIAAVQILLSASGLPGWSCPLHAVSGLPCPGCGLTRATEALAEGHWARMMELHAFAPVLVGFLVTVALAAGLPRPYRDRLVDTLEFIDRRTRLTGVLLLGLLLYWLVRLV